jgi:hypothetical protein
MTPSQSLAIAFTFAALSGSSSLSESAILPAFFSIFSRIASSTAGGRQREPVPRDRRRTSL